jgi:hypothetical protein
LGKKDNFAGIVQRANFVVKRKMEKLGNPDKLIDVVPSEDTAPLAAKVNPWVGVLGTGHFLAFAP